MVLKQLLWNYGFVVVRLPNQGTGVSTQVRLVWTVGEGSCCGVFFWGGRVENDLLGDGVDGLKTDVITTCCGLVCVVKKNTPKYIMACGQRFLLH